MPRSIRHLAGAGFAALVAFGLWSRDGISEGRWLALLGGGWLLLVLALWPRLPDRAPAFNRSALRTAALLASVFVVLSVQLVRIQVVRSRATVERVASDPNSEEVIANPRIQIQDLEVDRGSVYDRRGALLADTVFDNGVARRVYPDPESAYVVGYFSPLLYGKYGLEATFDDELRGRDGTNAIVRGLNDLLGQPQEGLDLHLTLDAELQRTAHALLEGRPGGAVLLDVETGEVLVLASNPHFDPNQIYTSGPAERDQAAAYWSSLLADPQRPLVPRATSGLFTPGSTFKVVSAAAVIEAGFATPDSTYQDDGRLDVEGHVIVEQNRPDDSQTVWTLREALAWSLNVVFARVGLQLGPDLMREYGERFGFGDVPPFALPLAQSQLATSPGFLDAPPALADTAFGQGELLATPLQMAMVTAAIANDGVMMRPMLVGSLRTSDGDRADTTEPRVWRRPISGETAAHVRELMVGAVESGLAQAAVVDGFVVGGKTGTAEAGDGEPHAWFIGFIGDPTPRYAVAVVLEHGGAGLAGSLEIGRDLLATAIQSAP